jgi:hypothetical protein
VDVLGFGFRVRTMVDHLEPIYCEIIEATPPGAQSIKRNTIFDTRDVQISGAMPQVQALAGRPFGSVISISTMYRNARPKQHCNPLEENLQRNVRDWFPVGYGREKTLHFCSPASGDTTLMRPKERGFAPNIVIDDSRINCRAQ